MKCMFCGHNESKVIDSRFNAENNTIKRRRECLKCKRRFTTYEAIEITPILVIKKDRTRETLEAGKIKQGIIKACEKRPVTIVQIDNIVNDIILKITNSMCSEIKANEIGDMVMDELFKLDKVAYIRFASVYMEFNDLEKFREFVKKIR